MSATARRPAGSRGRPEGAVTRGTTAPNRLRRVDRWMVAVLGARLRAAADPLVVDLGYGAAHWTTTELAARLATVRADVEVVGLEIDPDRVAAAAPFATPPRTTYRVGGFELDLDGRSPVLVRAFNVLRQYAEPEVAPAWERLRGRIAPDGAVVEGTCDELGRLATWVTLDADGPRTLTLAASLATLERPGQLAERLPKALIHHNVPGERIHALLADLDRAWAVAAPFAAFGARTRWVEAVARLEGAWPLRHARRARHGELTVDWSAVAA